MKISKDTNIHEQLVDAACTGNSDRILQLLEHGANPNYQDPTLRFNTPLMWAVTHGHKETAQVLFKAGADINISTSVGDTALIIASANGNLSIVNWLLLAGANHLHKNLEGSDALDHAAHNNHKEVVKVLKER